MRRHPVSDVSGFDIELDLEALSFEFGPSMHAVPAERRQLDAVRPSLMDEACEGPDLLYMQKGEGADVSDCRIVDCGPGDLYIVPPGWAHLTINIGTEPLAFGAQYLARPSRLRFMTHPHELMEQWAGLMKHDK